MNCPMRFSVLYDNFLPKIFERMLNNYGNSQEREIQTWWFEPNVFVMIKSYAFLSRKYAVLSPLPKIQSVSMDWAQTENNFFVK